MRATMQDIARQCGLTKMTVSRALSGHSSVKPATRIKVIEAANRLNYEVNVLAQNFIFGRSGYIGVATPFAYMLESSYLAESLRGFQLALNGSGTDLALFDTYSTSFNDGEKLAKLYRQRKVDGLLLVALHTTDRFLDTLRDIKIPMVVVGESVASSTKLHSVFCDDKQGVRLMCSHLFKLGHRRIAFIAGSSDYACAERRKAGYIDFCQKHGLKNPSWYIQQGDFSRVSARKVAFDLLRQEPRPTAIVTANDMMAFGVIDSARELKLRIPEDLSVGGFDDLPGTQDFHPSLTTIHQPVRLMAEQGAKILLQVIETGVAPSADTVMKVSLMIRESTAACPRV
jgi:DNA-binding LacI/PurR family transcriptional regulator